MSQTDDFLSKTKQSLSVERLSRYESKETPSDLDTLAKYFWNMALCEALYPCLQCLEVALRNAIHAAASEAFQDELWLDENRGCVASWHEGAVAQAKERLAKQGKEITGGALVSELNFGFWTSLFDSHYEVSLWRKIIGRVFPHLKTPLKNRKHLAGVFHKIRKLRNRAFHHESIWNRENIMSDHEQIIEAVGWISPALQAVAHAIDRFPQIYCGGAEPYRRILVDTAAEFDLGTCQTPPL